MPGAEIIAREYPVVTLVFCISCLVLIIGGLIYSKIKNVYVSDGRKK